MAISSLLVSGSVTEVSDNVSPGTSSDNTAFEAIAITGTSVSVGTLQYSTDGGSSFTNVGTVSGSSSLLLNSSDRLRLVSPTDFNGSAGSFTFRAWDQTTTASGSSGSKVDASTDGGTSEFSSFAETATITVNAVNDEPTASFQTPPAVN